jgi:hypothetical protein
MSQDATPVLYLRGAQSGLDTGHPCLALSVVLLSPPMKMSLLCLKLGHGCFIPQTFEAIIHITK